MSHHYTGRVTAILVVLFIALWAIVPTPRKLLDRNLPLGQKINLKPGIDMVGGTSLLYEIEIPEGTPRTKDLANAVMQALKRRVDPQGVKNLIWRPQGGNRLEIQMPLTAGAADSQKVREALNSASAAIESTNTRPEDVIDAVEQNNGKLRQDLGRLEMGSPQRKKLFAEMVDVYDQLQKLYKLADPSKAKEAAELKTRYEGLTTKPDPGTGKTPIEATNLHPADLDRLLSNKNKRDASLKSLTESFKGFGAREQALAAYVSADDAFQKVKGTIDDANELKRMLRGSGVLEFHILVSPDEMAREKYDSLVERLQRDGPRMPPGEDVKWYEVDNPAEFKNQSVKTEDGKSYVMAWVTPDKSLDNRSNREAWHLQSAYPETLQSGEKVVAFTFDPVGGRYFGDLTQANLHKPLAIVLDGKVISAPNIQSRIASNGTISGGGGNGFTRGELEYLVRTLDAGSLPAQLKSEPISERTVGSTLGADNLRKGLIACAMGLVVVAIFLISYYYLSGVIATFAVFLNVILILGTMAAINATFTLPSIAGIVLTIGTAVDANVLIFERLREEQLRGLSLRMALRNAYDRAFSAIIDSNMTTAITSFFLILFGSEEVKGFGYTLIIGIVMSLFTALFVTRTIFGILIDNFHITKLGSIPMTFPKWDRLLRPDVDWMGMAWIFYVFSTVAVVIGTWLFVHYAKKGQMMDIEFASGTSVQFELKERMPIDKVRHLFEKADQNALPSPSIVSVGRDERVYEVVTPNADTPRVRDAVLKIIGDKQVAQLPSSFVGVGTDASAALEAGTIIPLWGNTDPVKDASKWPGNYVPPGARSFREGVAIVLNKIDPPLKPREMLDRLRQQALQPLPGQTMATPDLAVEAPGGPELPARMAIVLASDSSVAYSKDKVRWQEDLVTPVWRLVNEAVHEPAKLQQVKNFNPQVANDARNNALLALTASMLVIMAYIWIRFGNLKYGTATVVALLHDTIFVIAALGFAHAMANTSIGNLLKLEPFRINLTIVAGILTIMGYSMIDTIVVFDRIRENRGKFGLVNKKVINDAVNQTLSRTILTAGTTMVSVAIMYFVGGSGIHGFTFVLLVGILVGTYSSIAIASPILLLGNKRPQETTDKRPAGQLQRVGA